MKAFSKLINLALTALTLTSVVACTAQPAATTAPENTAVAEVPTTASEPTAAPEATSAPEATTAPEAMEPVTLRYANWNLGTEEENNVQRQLVKAYTDANPHVTIEFVDMSGEGGWDAILTAYAAKGELPDVFMANNVPLYAQNGWLADLSGHVADDADWQNVPQILKDSFTYSDKVLGLPAAQFIMGYFVNKDLYEAANLDAPEYGFAVEDLEANAEALTDVDKAVLGLDEMEPIMGWYASTQDDALGWFSFDGAHMNYNSAAFKDAVAKAGELRQYTWQGLTDEQKANFKSAGPWEAFLNQEVAVRWDGGWVLPDYVQKATFEWDFIGIPGGSQALVADAIVVSQTAANLDEAYKFAHWMTFSSEAYALEVELAKAAGTAPKMPVSVDAASIDLYKQFVDKPGVTAALDNLEASVVESLAKLVPGYINARWEGKPGIDIGEDKDVNMWFMFNFANDGKFKYEDYAERLEEFANQTLDDAAAAVNK
ncbi:MAG TPA: extracellular solute-binding protein [Anaerolineales bacterium]|nr:extracellular solute-binding protein [Anaerolineales bacterium]